MRAVIDINIEHARMSLLVSAGSFEQSQLIEKMSDEEVKNLVIKHCRCWGISEVKDETDVNRNT